MTYAKGKPLEPERSLADAPTAMVIEDVFHIRTKGTVVTGKICVDELYYRDKIAIVGPKLVIPAFCCMEFETFQKMLRVAHMGQNIGIHMTRGDYQAVQSGMRVVRLQRMERVLEAEFERSLKVVEDSFFYSNFDGSSTQLNRAEILSCRLMLEKRAVKHQASLWQLLFRRTATDPPMEDHWSLRLTTDTGVIHIRLNRLDGRTDITFDVSKIVAVEAFLTESRIPYIPYQSSE